MAPLLGLLRGGGRSDAARPDAALAAVRSQEPVGSPPGTGREVGRLVAADLAAVEAKARKIDRGLRALCLTDRFRLWVSFVLDPEEQGQFERWAVSNDHGYRMLLQSFLQVKGSEDQESLLEFLRAVVGLRDEDEGAAAVGDRASLSKARRCLGAGP